MYLIQDMNPGGDQWRMTKNNTVVFTGGFKSILRYAVGEQGFDIRDFEAAVSALIYNNHNTLEFNSNKRLISTSHQPIAKLRKTG